MGEGRESAVLKERALLDEPLAPNDTTLENQWFLAYASDDPRLAMAVAGLLDAVAAHAGTRVDGPTGG